MLPQPIPKWIEDVQLGKSWKIRIYIWRTKREMKQVLGIKQYKQIEAYYQAYYPEAHDGLYASLHFACRSVDLETVGHEVQHALNWMAQEFELDSAESDDDEVLADLGGKLTDIVWNIVCERR